MTLENLHLEEVATPYSFLATFCLALLPDDRRLLRRRWQRGGGGGGSKVAVSIAVAKLNQQISQA